MRHTPRYLKAGIGSMVFEVCNTIFLLGLAFITLYPMYHVLIVSISEATYIVRGMVNFFPRGINFEAYRMVFRNDDIWRAYVNTLIYTSSGTAVQVLFTALCAYPLSRADFYGRKYFTIFIIVTMFISGGLIPNFLLIMRLGMINTIWAIILPPAISTYNMIIMRTFFKGIPVSLQESAYLDGANDIQILRKIILPLSKPILATMTLFYSVGHWNSFFPALLYLNSKSKYPVQLLLRDIVVVGEFQDQGIDVAQSMTIISTNYKYAVIIISVIPILCAYPFLQKHFAKGVMIGAVKG
jgi:putative aldouronate transport system permease protein